MLHPYGSSDTTTAWKKFYFILSNRSDFYIIDDLVHTFVYLKTVSVLELSFLKIGQI